MFDVEIAQLLPLRNMKNVFNPAYRQDYFDGYSCGFNPHYQLKSGSTSGFASGFKLGRSDYEEMNGCLSQGIPLRIVTNKVLEEFLLAGMLGMSINAEGFTPYQIEIIDKWYQSGIEKYDPDQGLYLLAVLERQGIEISGEKSH